MDVSSPRRLTQRTPLKYRRSVLAPFKRISTPTKPTSPSASENSENDSDVQDDSDLEVSPKKKSKVVSRIDDTAEEQLSSTVTSSGSPSTHRCRRGLRDLKVTGMVSNKWNSDDDDDSDELPNTGMRLHYWKNCNYD